MVAIKTNLTQQGFALFMTLVTLVIITISGISMMRVMEAGTSAAGNIAFRQAAIRVADVAAENARNWLQTTASLSEATVGYHANVTDLPLFNPITHPWDNDSMDVTGSVAGYNVTYVIHRMAVHDGLCATINTGCTYPLVAASTCTEGCSKDELGVGEAVGKVYYRITVKVSGPRRNISYVQVFMY